MRGISFAFAVALALAGAASAQSDGEAAVRAAMARLIAISDAGALQGPEGRALLSGELDAVTENSFGRMRPPDRIVLLGSDRAVARQPGEDAPDTYLYLRVEDGAWRITAGRTLALTGILWALRRDLRAINQRTAEQDDQLANVELTLAPDRAIAAWFAAHRAELERLRGLGATEDGRALARDLHLNDAGLRAEPNGIVRISIGGILDNEVGFLYAADPALVPPIDPSDHIWIEPLGDGWYLFRTT